MEPTEQRRPRHGHIVDAPPEPVQRVLLYAVVLAGLLFLLVGWAADAGLVAMFGVFLLTYAALVASSWLPPGRLSGRVDDFLDEWVGSRGSGFYSLVALASFVSLEAQELGEAIAELDLAGKAFDELVLPRLIGFSIDSLINTVLAAAWPLQLLRGHSVTAALLFAGAAWTVFYLGSRLFPTEPLALRRSNGDGNGDGNGNGSSAGAEAGSRPPMPPPTPPS